MTNNSELLLIVNIDITVKKTRAENKAKVDFTTNIIEKIDELTFLILQ